MPSLITTFTTPVDPGGGNPGRTYLGPTLGANWTNLSAGFGVTGAWSGAFRIDPGESPNWWFNRFPQPPSPFSASDPNPLYVTTALDRPIVYTNNGAAGMQATVQVFGDTATPGPH